MKKFKWDYEYVNVEQGENQYNDFDFDTNNVVQARYVESPFEIDKGNPFVEALPYPRAKEDIKFDYEKPLYEFDKNLINKWDINTQKRSVMMLRNLRIPLPFHKLLEESFYKSLILSYRARYLSLDKEAKLPVVIQQKECVLHNKLYGDDADAANTGFTLLGYSGCGKSSSLKILLNNYPQVIYHYPDSITRIPQIVYLVVNCIPNSNFSSLYTGIGAAIDRALGNIEPVYETMLSKIKNLGNKAEKVRELIELFSIGIIILDEIQLIDFESTKENSFESLLTLTNRTKVAFGIIGTEDARNKMFQNGRTTRRIGEEIKADLYCNNPVYFEHALETLFKYQWFKENVEITHDIYDSLYKCTKGIIDQLISVYMFMQIDYLDAKKKPEINGEFIENVANKHFQGMQEILTDINTSDFEKKKEEINRIANEEFNKIINTKQESFLEEIVNNENQLRINLKENVIKNIQICLDDYTLETISLAFDKVYKIKINRNKDERELTRLTVKQLQKYKTNKNKISELEMETFINS